MNTLSRLTLLTSLTLALGTAAYAQGHPDAPRGRRPHDGRPPADAPARGARAVEHLTGAYATVAPFDANRDGQLDSGEKEALAKAIADGSVTPPAHRRPPAHAAPEPNRLLTRIAGMYGAVAAHDANHDGTLSPDEQTALKAAIEDGDLPRPGGRRGGRPEGLDGRRGPRQDRDGGPRGERGGGLRREREERDDRGDRGERGERGGPGERGNGPRPERD